MQFSGMLGRLLEVACEIAFVIAFEVAFEIANFVPHPGIRIKHQAANGNPSDEITCRGEKLFRQTPVFGEEQNIAHEPADGFCGRQLIDTVLRTLLQKKQSGDRSRAVLTGLGELSGKRSAEGRVPVDRKSVW